MKYDDLSPEEKEKYHQEWYQFKELHHDLELEKKIDKLNIEIEEPEIFKNHKKDFEVTYKTNYEIMDQCFSHRSDLKMLFEKGFKYIVIKPKTDLYQRLYRNRHRALRSPETNICEYDRNNLSLFIKDNLIYSYSGACYYRDNNTFSFNYVGRILNKGESRQLSIFDII